MKPVDAALNYKTPQSGSKRLFIFTFNEEARKWQRHTAHASIVDEDARLVRTKLDHFSLYGVMLQDMGFTPPPTPAPPPPITPPPPPSPLLPILYGVGSSLFAILLCAGGCWQIARFRERRRLRAVALEMALKKRREAEGDYDDRPWWEVSQEAPDELLQEDPEVVERRERKKKKRLRRAARLKQRRLAERDSDAGEEEEEEEEEEEQEQEEEDEETAEQRKQRRRERKERKAAAARRCVISSLTDLTLRCFYNHANGTHVLESASARSWSLSSAACTLGDPTDVSGGVRWSRREEVLAAKKASWSLPGSARDGEDSRAVNPVR